MCRTSYLPLRAWIGTRLEGQLDETTMADVPHPRSTPTSFDGESHLQASGIPVLALT
jgi:hypothetical protein